MTTNRLHNACTLAGTFFAVALAGTAPAQAQALRGASSFNAFVFGNASLSGDTEGRLAVGGSLSLNGSFGIADRLDSSANGTDTLVVGGNFTTNGHGGQLFYGNGKVGGSYGGSYSAPNGTITGGVSPLSVDFADVQSGLLSDSAYWAASWASFGVAGATTLYPWGGVELNATGLASNAIAVFNLNAADIGTGKNTLILNGSSTQTFLINVAGTNVTSFQGGWQINGSLNESRILWNFPDATALTIQTGWNGSVLAPKAIFTGSNGHLEGNLVVGSVNSFSGFETHIRNANGVPSGYTGTVLFQGGLPPSPSVATPEPGTLTLALTALGALWVRRRRATH